MVVNLHRQKVVNLNQQHMVNLNRQKVVRLTEVCTYATNVIGTTYGNQLSTKTSAVLPKILTTSITSITSTTATSGGNITSDGGSPITARGICWGINSNTSIANNKTTDGTGIGNYTSSITGLTAGNNYYTRAYATNSVGTVYGDEVSFSTLATLPTITTSGISNITSTTAIGGGNITSSGGGTIIARGVCWSTISNPTIANNKTSDNIGIGIFTSSVTGLTAGATYYLRAYATNSAGTAYGNELSFKSNSLQSHDYNKVQIPVGGNAWADNGATITTEGLTNWNNSASVCKTYIRLSQSGTLKISLKINATNGNNVIKVTVLNKSVLLQITGNTETEVFVGMWDVANEGYLSIDVQGISKTSVNYGTLSNIFVSGSAVTEGMNYVPNNEGNMFYWSRRGTSLYLGYDITGINNIEWFYNEIKVPTNYDVIGSYYMANGFGEGYFGMQVNSAVERHVLFSVWSPNSSSDPSAIPPEDQVLLIRKGANVYAGTFGNEGSGGQSYLVYNWKAENTYKFLLQGKPIDNNYTQYTAWFFAPEESKWLLIASWKRPKTSTYIKGIYSFLENFDVEGGAVTRMAYYGNQWIKEPGGNWKEITKATFTGTGESVYRKDYAGGILNGTFYLKTAGFFNQFTPLNQSYQRQPINIPPNINIDTLP